MKKALVVVSIVALGVGLNALRASAKPNFFEVKYSNCTQLNKVHPGGIAISASAAKSATLSGYLNPTVSKSAYQASKTYGDYAGTGFSCPKFSKSSLGTIKLKTEWGYLTASKVKRPMNGICVFIPIVVEVRNATKVNSSLGIKITLEDDFENVIGHQIWFGANYDSTEVRNGKFNTSLKVCKVSHKWKPDSDWGAVQVDPIGSENWYWINSYSWLGNGFQGRSDFEFKK